MSNSFDDIRRHIQKSKKHQGMKLYRCRRCGFATDNERIFREHLRFEHFAPGTSETLINHSIEQLFSNKNNPFQSKKTICGKRGSANEAQTSLNAPREQQQLTSNAYDTLQDTMLLPISQVSNTQTQQSVTALMPQQSMEMSTQMFYDVEPTAQQQQQQHILSNVNLSESVNYGTNRSNQEESSQIRFLLNGQDQHHQQNESSSDLHLLAGPAIGDNNRSDFQVSNNEHRMLQSSNELHLHHQQQQQQVDSFLEQYM